MLFKSWRERRRIRDYTAGYKWAARLLLRGDMKPSEVLLYSGGRSKQRSFGACDAAARFEELMSTKSKWKRYDAAIARLKAKGIEYELFNNSLELRFKGGIKFWPTTGTITVDEERQTVKGIDALLEII